MASQADLKAVFERGRMVRDMHAYIYPHTAPGILSAHRRLMLIPFPQSFQDLAKELAMIHNVDVSVRTASSYRWDRSQFQSVI